MKTIFNEDQRVSERIRAIDFCRLSGVHKEKLWLSLQERKAQRLLDDDLDAVSGGIRFPEDEKNEQDKNPLS